MTDPGEPPSHDRSRRDFAAALATLPDLAVNAEDVLEDLHTLETVFADPVRYAGALREIVRQLRTIARRGPAGRAMWGRFAGWWRVAFQSTRQRGSDADLRIVYRQDAGVLEILGFGHRHLPVELYRRLRDRPGPAGAPRQGRNGDG